MASAHLCEEVGTALREADERSAPVEFKPAPRNRAVEPRPILYRRAPVLEQKRPVDFLDVNTAPTSRSILRWEELRGSPYPDFTISLSLVELELLSAFGPSIYRLR
jgi:hypothetical protein